jgi:hypothetical protein
MRYKVLGFSGIGNWQCLIRRFPPNVRGTAPKGELGIGKKVSCTSRVRELLYIAELCQAKNFGYSVRLFSFYGPFMMVNRTYSIGLYRIETEFSRFITFIKLAEALFDQAFGLFTCIYFSAIQP